MVRGTICGAVVLTLASSARAQTTVTIEDLLQFELVLSFNNDGLIAGTADRRAIIAKAGEAATVIDGGLGDPSSARVVNDKGQVSGFYSVPSLGVSQAFFYDPELGTMDMSLPETRGASATINELGQMFWTTTNDSRQTWMNVRDEVGEITSIAIPRGHVFDANVQGQALSLTDGTVTAVTTFSNGTLSHTEIDHPSYFSTELFDINDLGQAVGRVGLPNRAVLWDEDNGLRDLIGPGEADGFTHIAHAINDYGLVALTLVPDNVWPDAEFAFYSLGQRLTRLEQPDIPEPAACAPGTFNVSTFGGVPKLHRDETLNNLGQALVRVRLECKVGDSFPIIFIPAIATVEEGVRLIPLPRGLQVEDLFQEVVDEYGQTLNVYDVVTFERGTLNDRGQMIGNFRTETWDDVDETTAHLYDLTPMPIADIEANGFDPPLTVSAGESVNITLALDPGEKLGQPGEYWGILLSSFGNFVLFDSQAELVEFGETSLFDVPLPVGWYVFVFNVDDTPDGLYQPGWFDYVVVEVKP